MKSRMTGKNISLIVGKLVINICIKRWVSKMVKKKFKSTVLCCAFHPHNGQLLATGSADFKCRVYSTFDSTVDAAPSQGHFEKPLEFGEVYCEMSSHGWITGVAWSPSGDSLCYSGNPYTLSDCGKKTY